MEETSWKRRWRIVDPLSSGGQGYTFKAALLSEEASPVRVLKVLKDQKNFERRSRFYRESIALSTLVHPDIPQFIETNASLYQDTAADLYIVSEFIEGSAMSTVCSPVDLVDACCCVESILQTLKFCHEKGFLHRDLKPDNIILRKKSLLKPVVIDFGQTFNSEVLSAMTTPTGQQLGNRFLGLPELAVSGSDKRNQLSDIAFCVGLFFFLLTGKNPEGLRDHQGRKPQERSQAAAVLKQRFPEKIAALNRIFSVGFAEMFEERWQSIDALKHQISNLHETAPGQQSFSDRLSSIGKSLLNDPEHIRRDVFMDEAKKFDEAMRMLSNQLEQAELAKALRIGFSIGGKGIATSNASYVFEMAHRQLPKTLRIDIELHREQTQLMVQYLARENVGLFSSGEPQYTNIFTSPMSDPGWISDALAAVGNYIADTLESWTAALPKPSQD